MTKKQKKNLPVKRESTELITVNQEKINPLDITQKLHHLKTRADVRKYLPDILGRVLARIWIDQSFKDEFAQNPKKHLSLTEFIFLKICQSSFKNRIQTDLE